MLVESENTNTTRQPHGTRVRDRDPIDIHVGKRVKLRRALLQVSQEQLAGDIGVTFQQIQKYEKGQNRVSASRLFDVARSLNCTVAYFFEDISHQTWSDRLTPVSRRGGDGGDNVQAVDADPMQRTETLELVRAYWRLGSAEVRRNVLELLANISRQG